MESLKILQGDIQTLRDSFHAHALQFRNIDYIIQTETFEVAYQAATQEEKDAIRPALLRGDKAALEQFISKQLGKLTPFEQMTIRRLRILGQHHKIKDYQYLNKQSLIEEIRNEVQRAKENASRIPCEPEQQGLGCTPVHSGN